MAWPTDVSPATDSSSVHGAPVAGRRPSRRSTPAVLVAEDDLEGEDVLAVALEAEVTRLDDAGVHRPHRDLVDLLALHAEERVVAGDGGWGSRRDPRGRPRARAVARSGAASARGVPPGRTPNCSKISRSKAWSVGHSAASEGQEAPTRQERTPSRPWASSASTAVTRVRSPSARPRSSRRGRPAATASATICWKSSTERTGTSRGDRSPRRSRPGGRGRHVRSPSRAARRRRRAALSRAGRKSPSASTASIRTSGGPAVSQVSLIAGVSRRARGRSPGPP